jgi:cytochrome c oxidase cbb3-type subunit 3
MRLPPLAFALLAVLGTVAGGALECTPPKQAYAQHHGGEVYGRMCAVCHGLSGEGYKADQAPAIGHSDFLASASDKYLYNTINDGRAGTTMSAWGFDRGGPLRRRDVDDTIAFLRTWQKDAPAVLDERPLHGDARKGATVYARECARCHGARGTGGQYVAIGGAQLLANATDGFLRRAILGGRRGTAMPAFDGTLDDASVENVVALLRDWQKSGPPVAFQRATPARPPPIPLGPVPLNPKGPEPVGFSQQPKTTKAELIKHELDRGAKMALLDARAPSDYIREHITGAVSVPFYDPDPYFSQLPKNAWLVCYCSCPHAESGQLAMKLSAAGFKKVTVLDEGLGFWHRQGYPTRSGLDP